MRPRRGAAENTQKAGGDTMGFRWFWIVAMMAAIMRLIAWGPPRFI